MYKLVLLLGDRYLKNNKFLKILFMGISMLFIFFIINQKI
jgi:hypothetical protein